MRIQIVVMLMNYMKQQTSLKILSVNRNVKSGAVVHVRQCDDGEFMRGKSKVRTCPAHETLALGQQGVEVVRPRSPLVYCEFS